MAKGRWHKVARWILGLMLLVFGLNGFFQFFAPPEMGPAAMSLMQAFMASGYIMVVVNLLMLLVGILLVANKYVPLALVLLAPLSVNLILFHLFLDIGTIGPSLVVTLLNLYLMVVHRAAYKGLTKQ